MSARKTTHEELLETLRKIVTEDRFYRVLDIRDAMIQHLGCAPDWLSAKWVGCCLSRRFKLENKKMSPRGTHAYRITPQLVKALIKTFSL